MDLVEVKEYIREFIATNYPDTLLEFHANIVHINQKTIDLESIRRSIKDFDEIDVEIFISSAIENIIKTEKDEIDMSINSVKDRLMPVIKCEKDLNDMIYTADLISGLKVCIAVDYDSFFKILTKFLIKQLEKTDEELEKIALKNLKNAISPIDISRNNYITEYSAFDGYMASRILLPSFRSFISPTNFFFTIPTRERILVVEEHNWKEPFAQTGLLNRTVELFNNQPYGISTKLFYASTDGISGGLSWTKND